MSHFNCLDFWPWQRKTMSTVNWKAELEKQEHKNWVTVGCALNIAKNGIAPQIQSNLEAWYQSLISSPPLQSLSPCFCVRGGPKCGTCVKWETEIKRLHTSKPPAICWNNSDRKQWGSPNGAWEIAKIFMPTLGKRKTDVTDSNTTDILGLVNLLKRCPFIVPTVSQKVLDSVRDDCRNKWAHAPNQELQDADVKTILGHLNSLLNESVFSGDKAAQSSCKDLQDLDHVGLVNITESEVEALRLLRLSLVDDLCNVKEQSDLNREEIVELRKQLEVQSVQQNIAEVFEQGRSNRKEIAELSQQLDTKVKDIEDLKVITRTISNTIEDFNRLINERDDLQEAFDLIREDLGGVTRCLQNTVEDLDATKSQVANQEIKIAGLQKDFMEVMKEVNTLKEKPSQAQNSDDRGHLFTAPIRLTAFTGRESALAWLEQNLVDSSPINDNFSRTDCCTKALCGLGGCGKTCLSVEFAWKLRDFFRGGVFWINGENDDNIRNSVVEILASLKLPVPTADSTFDTLNTFLTWLSDNEFPWLLVLDNTDEFTDPACPTGVLKICNGSWKRNGKAPKHGNILLTTRQNVKDTAEILKLSTADCLNLRCFSEEEAALFLMRRTSCTGLGTSLDPDAILLAKELGFLPLALEQAAAYLSTSPIPCNFKDYLDKYRAVKLDLLKQQPATPLSIEAKHRLSVHTTWLMNFESVAKISAAAAKMMRIAAFLNPGCIPIDVINPGFPELDDDELRESTRSVMDIAAILKEPSRYSLFSVDHETKVFRIHNLVQDVVRDSLTTSERTKILIAATRVLHFALQAKREKLLKLSNFFAFGKMSQEMKKESDVVTGLLLNLRPLKDHMERELDLSKGKSELLRFNFDVLSLFSFACDLIRNIVLFNELRADLSEFQLKFARMCDSVDPNLYLNVMVSSSICKRNSSDGENQAEAEKLAKEAAQKLIDLENNGSGIKNDIKYDVRRHRASFYEPKIYYEELLELEGLQISEAKIADLQICIANTEKQLSTEHYDFESVLRRYETALTHVRNIYPPDHPELLHVLQLITSHLYQNSKIQEALAYAKEILKFTNNLPKESDGFIKGLTIALLVVCVFDPYEAQARLIDILEDRWPSLYTLVMQEKKIDSSAIEDAVGHGGSDEHLHLVAKGLETCFQVISSYWSDEEWITGKYKLNFYLRISEMKLLVDNEMRKRYGNSHQRTEDDITYQPHVARQYLKNSKQESHLKVKAQFDQLKEFLPKTLDELNTNHALKLRQSGNELFKKRNYKGALELYEQALCLSPSKEEVAKILTNKVETCLRLWKQEHSANDQDAKLPSCSATTNEDSLRQERSNVLNHALEDCQNAITADPSWVEGYYWKAVCLAHLDKRGPSLAAAALANHLLPRNYASIPEVVTQFGHYDTQLVATVKDLLHATERTDPNLVIVINEGRYHLPECVTLPVNAVIVGYGDVRISTSAKDVPLQLGENGFIEGIALFPPTEVIAKLTEEARESLSGGQLPEVLAKYTEALTHSPGNAQILASRATMYLKYAKKTKGDLSRSKRKSFLEKALNDSKAAIAADFTCLLGYYNKATSLARLGRRQESLVAAAVFKHLSSGREVPRVTRRYGDPQVFVTENADELIRLIEDTKCEERLDRVILRKDGKYLMSADVPPDVTFSVSATETKTLRIFLKNIKIKGFGVNGFVELRTLRAAAEILRDLKCGDRQDRVMNNELPSSSLHQTSRGNKGGYKVILTKDGEHFLVSAIVIGERRLAIDEIETFLPVPHACNLENRHIFGDFDIQQESQDCNSNNDKSEVMAMISRPTTDDRRRLLFSPQQRYYKNEQIFEECDNQQASQNNWSKVIVTCLVIYAALFFCLTHDGFFATRSDWLRTFHKWLE